MGKSDVPTLPKQKLLDRSIAEEFSAYFSTKIADIRSPLTLWPNLGIQTVPLKRSPSFRSMVKVVVWIGYCR